MKGRTSVGAVGDVVGGVRGRVVIPDPISGVSLRIGGSELTLLILSVVEVRYWELVECVLQRGVQLRRGFVVEWPSLSVCTA
jgi:hypothetical protein